MENKSIKNSYNKRGFYFFLATISFSSLWVIYFIMFSFDIDIDEYTDQTKNQLVKIEGLNEKDLEKPWVSSENFIKHGNKIYTAQCALCHGAKGLGEGSPGLVPPPRNFVEGKWTQGGSSKALFVTLQKGIEGSSMLSFKHLPKEDRWALVHYIRSITKNKVPDDQTKLEEFSSQAL